MYKKKYPLTNLEDFSRDEALKLFDAALSYQPDAAISDQWFIGVIVLALVISVLYFSG